MSKNNLRANYPNQSQVALLKAALLTNLQVAEKHFESWLIDKYLDQLDVQHPDFLSHFMDPLDTGSQRLIPLLHHNLTGSKHAYIPYLIGHTKKTWFRNKQIEFFAQKLQAQLEEHQIPSIIMKGLDYANNYYPAFSSRPMNDGDLLISLRDKEKFFKLYYQGVFDFTISEGVANMLDFTHAAHLEYPYDVDIDLHWNLFPEYAEDLSVSDLVWKQTKQDAKGNLRLSETMTLYVALTHGRNFDPIPPFRWVSDSMLISKNSNIDWEVFYELTQQLQFKPFIIHAVNYLKEEFGFEIPDDVLIKLNLIQPSYLEKQYYNTISMDIRTYGIFSLFYVGLKRRIVFYQLFLIDYYKSIWHYLFSWLAKRIWIEIEKYKNWKNKLFKNQ
ncbi:nucleotidyltransferase family protein [Aquirufa sp. ROCK2-A2]